MVPIMTDAERDRAVIKGTNGDYVALMRDPSRSGGHGISTIIEIAAGPFCGRVTDDLWYMGEFHDQLLGLHKTLTGEAVLYGDGAFKMTLRGNGRGQIRTEVEAIARHVPIVRLTFETETDQTYLPGIAAAIRRVFLADPPPNAWLYKPISFRVAGTPRGGTG